MFLDEMYSNTQNLAGKLNKLGSSPKQQFSVLVFCDVTPCTLVDYVPQVEEK
jgi:hypothetical protein